VDAAIAELATRQNGVVDRSQLFALGLKRSAIARRVDRRRLHRVFPGVYAVGHRKLSQQGRWMAAVLAGGGDAVLMQQSAAALHAFAPDDERTVHVSGHHRNRNRIQFHRVTLRPDEVTRRSGIPVTTATRTLLDLASSTTEPRLERALREALFKKATTLPALSRLLSTHKGNRGAGALTEAIENTKDAPGRLRSNPEQRFANWLRRQGLPLPKLNVTFELDDRAIEVDCHWPEHDLVAEIDHRSTHAQRHAFETDPIRDRTLQAHGLKVIRIAEPYDDRLRDDLRRLLERRYA
jgi:very-short-patch-repair endonuclease